MRKFFSVFFMALGVIFFILLIGLAAFLMIDPFGVRSVFVESADAVLTPEDSSTATTDAHPTLSAGQEEALRSFGIDPATLPNSITPEQETCFVTALGSARVEEIKAGATPTMTDFVKARGCM